MAMLQTGLANAAAAATGYQIARSLRFNSADSAYLSRTPSSTTNQKTFTMSFWVKRSALGANQKIWTAGSAGTEAGIQFFGGTNNDGIEFYDYSSSAYNLQLTTTQLFRDVSAFYHLMVAVDTTQAIASNRVKLYVNGMQITAFSTATYPSQNFNTKFNTSAIVNNIGALNAGVFFSGYIADVYFIDGQALDPTSFGQTDSATGVWVPKAYTGTYGTNGFWLKLDDNSGVTATTLGKDSSGNGNNWTPNNFSVTAGVGNDSLVDSPTNYGTDTGVGGEVRGNYCTLNALDNPYTLANGNLDVSSSVASTHIRSNIALPLSGKFYFEYTCSNAAGANRRDIVGISDGSVSRSVLTGTSNSGGYLSIDGKAYTGPSATVAATYATWTNGDVIGCAIDCATGKVWFYKNGTIQGGDPVAGTTPAFTLNNNGNLFFAIGNDSSSGTALSVNGSANFGQRPFAYTAPSGFKALCTTNLPTPAIAKPNTNFDVVIYTGTGSALSISSLGFQPDAIWLKGRSGATDHAMYDRVRGVQLDIGSNLTTAETTQAQGVTAFNSNGFSIGTLAKLNTNAATYVGWAWKAGNSAGSSNTSGTITSTVSVNTTAGISVVTYTGNGTAGATIGHGLGVAPKLILLKKRNGATPWNNYFTVLDGSYDFIPFDSTSTKSDSAQSVPTSTVFSVSNGTNVNNLNDTYVAWCFAEVPGFSRFGAYTGNFSTDGPFLYCGFRPRFIMFRRTDVADAWTIFDSARSTANIANLALYPSGSTIETTETNNPFDIVSNGFKVRGTGTTSNASSGSYIFAAFAETPFNYARAR